MELRTVRLLNETMPAPVEQAKLTPDGLIKYRCLCGQVSWHETNEVGRIVMCDCDRAYAVPSPVELSLLTGSAVVQRHCQVIRTPKATLVFNTPIIAPADWHNATSPRSVTLVPRKSRNLLPAFLLGLIAGLGVLAIAGSLSSVFVR